jgi:hypothetical protein
MQIHPGHAICEGRKPALMDSLFQVGGGGAQGHFGAGFNSWCVQHSCLYTGDAADICKA